MMGIRSTSWPASFVIATIQPDQLRSFISLAGGQIAREQACFLARGRVSGEIQAFGIVQRLFPSVR
jgi:hypothetical protein